MEVVLQCGGQIMAKYGTLIGTHAGIARDAFVRARAWYKGAEKSGNKAYGGWLRVDEAEWPADLADKIRRSRERAAQAQQKIFRTFNALSRYDAGMSAAQGRFIRERELKAGNCDAMTSVAISFAADEIAGATEIWHVSLGGLADHAFMLVGPAPTLPGDAGVSIRDLNQLTAGVTHGANALYVVDVWAGICCHASEYEHLFSQQMREWGELRKEVFSPTDGWRDPSTPGYLEVTLTAPMNLTRCNI
jgi:hypothetical protein